MKDLGRLHDRAVLIRWLDRNLDGTESPRIVKALRKSQLREQRVVLHRLARIRDSDWIRTT